MEGHLATPQHHRWIERGGCWQHVIDLHAVAAANAERAERHGWAA